MAKLITLQAADGFWRSDLLNTNAFPTPESSGTAFFCFALAWGMNHGVLDRATYLDSARRAWSAFFFQAEDGIRVGRVTGVRTCALPISMQEAVEAAAARSGTPFVSHYAPDEMVQICRAAGFSAAEHVSPDDLTSRYFAGRADGLRPPTDRKSVV